MASSRFYLASLLLCVLAIHLAESHHVLEHQKLTRESTDGSPVSESAVVTALNCGGACVIRCSKSSRPNLCKRACGTCCARCKCVPPGTYGNYDSCPCYAALTTRGGAHKCP
uniref:GASA n=1 Tax=Hosta ventricosa TaxID=39527 RepID=A0A3G6ZEZ1_9ASPA|nr:GASA [Hosta ventricosa]